MNNEISNFINAHQGEDTARLRLKYRGDTVAEQAITQIELLNKSGNKFTTSAGASLLPSTLYSGVSIEQATSADIARFHASLAKGCHKILDMTMGMGIDATCLAQLPDTVVTAIEQNPELAEINRQNYGHIKNLRIICADSTEWLSETTEQFDLIFIDPARRDVTGDRVINLHQCTPDITEIAPLVFKHTDRMLVKLSPMLDITAVAKELPMATDIYVVEQKGECRELLVVASSTASGEVAVHIVIIGNGIKAYDIGAVPQDGIVNYGLPKPGDYLYEPSSAAMKSGGYRWFAHHFELAKLSPNSHLYFSNEDKTDFPGRKLIVKEVLPYASSVIKRFAKTYPKCEVATRNFPITSAQLRAKLKVKEDSQIRVMGTTDQHDRPWLLVLERPGH